MGGVAIGYRGAPRRRVEFAARCLATALAAAACVSPQVPQDGRFRHPEAGYSIAWPGAEWRPAKLPEADLALRDPRGNTLAMIRRCRVPLAEPAVLARHLRIGLGRPEVRAEGPVETPWGDPAWEQVFAARGGEPRIHVKAVTSTQPPCVFDWVLTTVGPPGILEPSFDAWWRSFDPGPPQAAVATPPRRRDRAERVAR